ncbi:MAG: hypothetical protein JWN33_527 [Candidatus Saccharibacteria bacterium]|nr:hypothetical protein [Candidatus Saccharibacteria bacterium]
MKQSITQEYGFGCGIACYAFVLGISYTDAKIRLGSEQASSERFWVKSLADALNKAGLGYEPKYIKPHIRSRIYQEGVIVLIKRSKRYPVGHYLVRHQNAWMDPWINLPYNANINEAKSGFRKRLPGAPMYAILPMPE